MAPLNWATYLERAVGKGHPTLPQTIDRALREALTATGLDPDVSPFPGLASFGSLTFAPVGPVFNIRAFAVSGASDYGPAVTAAAAAAAAMPNGGVVHFPAGNYPLLTAPVLDGIVGVTFQGDGANATALIINAAVNVFSFTGACNRIHIRDMWIGSFAARASGAGISLVGSSGLHSGEFYVSNVTIQNIPIPLFFQYADKLRFQDVQVIQSIASAVTSVVWYMDNCIEVRMRGCWAFVTAGGTFPNNIVQIDHDCDTIVMAECSWLHGGDAGVRLIKSSGTTGPRLCRFTNVYVESCVNDGFFQSDGQSIHYTDCHSAVNGGNGFHFTGGKATKVRGGFSLQNGLHGYFASGAGIDRLSFLDITATNNSQLTHNTYDGVRIEDNTMHVSVGFSTLGDFYVSLANKQRYGLSIGSVGTDYITAWGNDGVGNQTASLGDFSTGSHNLILDGQTVKRLPGRVKTLTDAATIADVDPRLGTIFTVTLGGNRTMGVALDGANWIAGQRITFLVSQDGTGGRTLAWHSSYKQSWSDTGNTASKRSTISFVYAGDGTWAQDGAQTPYV